MDTSNDWRSLTQTKTSRKKELNAFEAYGLLYPTSSIYGGKN